MTSEKYMDTADEFNLYRELENKNENVHKERRMTKRAKTGIVMIRDKVFV